MPDRQLLNANIRSFSFLKTDQTAISGTNPRFFRSDVPGL